MTEREPLSTDPVEDDWDDELSTFRGGQALTDPVAELLTSTSAPEPVPPAPRPPRGPAGGETEPGSS